jgi:hypothetical protein
MVKLSAKALAKYEASRNLGDELLAAARDIKTGKAARVHHIKVPEILEARMRTGLSQQKFADVLGVSTRTLQVDSDPSLQRRPLASAILRRLPDSDRRSSQGSVAAS